MQTPICPKTIDETQQLVCRSDRILAVGVRTKPPMSHCDDDVTAISMTNVSGIVEYAPTEFIITVLAGTPAKSIDAELRTHSQYLPFDPLLINQGATIGGIVAAGVSGPCRLRHGGVRDFVIGVQFIDGMGKRVRGGGKVVKNAAGFDFPKMMVGSCGRLGVLTEITLKVLPRPPQYSTLQFSFPDLALAIAFQARLLRSALELEAIDLEPPAEVLVRVAGLPDAIEALARRVSELADVPSASHSRSDPRVGDEELWRPLQNGTFAAADQCLVRATLTPRKVCDVSAALQQLQVKHRFSIAGNVVWIAWPDDRDLEELDETLRNLNRSATVLTGDADRSLLGADPAVSFRTRIQNALDPQQKFPRWPVPARAQAPRRM